MSIYQELGVGTHINATASLTALGGSLMPHEVLDAMRSADSAFVDIHELQGRIGDEIASMTHNEGAYVTSGCAAGLALATMASRTRGDLVAVARIADVGSRAERSIPHEVVMIHGQRMPYDLAVGLGGARIRTVGNPLQTFDWELEAALTADTCAVVYVVGELYKGGMLPLESVIRIAHAHDLPVIVDAAAQVPPVRNLWKFTAELGADLAVFSGGKEMRGPQSSGLIVGKRTWIDAVRAVGPPHQRLGRAFKVGKEEMVGLYAAVRRFVHFDHRQWYLDQVRDCAELAAKLGDIPGVVANVEDRNRVGAEIPRVRIELPPSASADQLVSMLRAGQPSIIIRSHEPGVAHVGLDLLVDGQLEILTDRLLASVRSCAASGSD
jgi:L-seryl-tRNA(Ser) seleniumtransferase